MLRRLPLPLFVLMIYLFLYAPIIILVLFSFNSKSFPAPWHSFTLHWYRELFQCTELWQSLRNSLLVASTATCTSLFLGVCLIFFQSSGGRVKKFIPLFYGSLVIPETILAVGLISYFAILHIPLGLVTLMISHTVIGLGFSIPVLFVRYFQLDPRLKEASLVLGASPMQTFFRITLPLLRPTIIACGLLTFVISFDDFVLSYFCSGTAVQTLSIYLVNSLRFGISPVVNALSVLLLVLTTILALIFFSPKIRTRIF
ncbi:MAG: ABC transporter permease [Chlamydiae bacterium]|nr:ABC transporter permease [Chlamydiota bacterium]